MEVTLLGTVISWIEAHPEKVLLSIEVKLSGKEISVKFVQS